MKFSKLAQTLTGSATMNATLKAQQLKKEGKDILLASVGEPDADVDQSIKEVLCNEVMSHPSRYGPAQGLLSTREALSKWFKKIYGAQYSSKEIIITPGSKFGLFALLQILCDAGDEVIIPAPYWVSYVTLTEMAKATPRICLPDKNYKLTATTLKQNLSEKTRLLILNSPNNPSGAVYTKDELHALYLVLKKFPHVTVLCDDIYNQLLFSDSSRAPSLLDINDDDFKKQIVVVHGASKSYAMTGWRMGWIAADVSIIEKLTQFFSQTLTCTPDFIQKTVEQALTNGDSSVEKLRSSMAKRHAYVFNELKNLSAIRVYPSEGAFYIWFELVDKSQSSTSVVEKLLTEQGIAGVTGEAFGMPHHIRLSVTLNEDDLKKLVVRLKLFFEPTSVAGKT